MDTDFAPAGRDSADQLRERVAVVENTPILQRMLDALPNPVVILNENRQIVSANRALLGMLSVDATEVIGRRTGEVMGCAYWPEGPDGCGTTRHCLTCGAVAAVLESQRTQGQATRECRLTLAMALDGGARDLRVSATAVDVGCEQLTICAIEDISKQKRLNVLSRVFFHDVLNTAGGIQGFTRLLEGDIRSRTATMEEIRQLSHLAEQLITEIESQRDLTLAESGDLDVEAEPVHTRPLLEELRALYANHTVAESKHIELGEIWDGCLVTDARLLARVLGNMLKNALEATPKSGTVSVRCVRREREVAFSVQNPSVMPEEVQLQVFQRSFSTKARHGRGIGTYSMKLLGEHYLGGRVTFASSEPDGTTFTVTLPRMYTPRLSTPESG